MWNDSQAAKLTSFAARLAREVHECFLFPESGREQDLNAEIRSAGLLDIG